MNFLPVGDTWKKPLLMDLFWASVPLSLRFVDAFPERAYHRPMAIHTLLFDLDGTLLPIDQDQFMHAYFALFVRKAGELGLDEKAALAGLQAGLKAMLSNNGEMTNKDRFDLVFSQVSGIESDLFNEQFSSFYQHEFHQLAAFAKPSLLAHMIVEKAKEKGYQVALATSPLFPAQGTEARIGWAGLHPDQFSLVSTYETYRHAKPHWNYYVQVLDELGVEASDCLMIGNDVREDMVVAEHGMETFLVTDCLINRDDRPLHPYRKGSLEELFDFLGELPPCKR
jgi:FMN phosphatase YigB (HAD superfamily)